MLFIERDANGAIRSICRGEGKPGKEPASLLDDEVIAFLKESGEIDALTQVLASSDSSLIRVLEDLVEVLITKNVLMLTDLPIEAQEKIRRRKDIRRQLKREGIIVDDIL